MSDPLKIKKGSVAYSDLRYAMIMALENVDKRREDSALTEYMKKDPDYYEAYKNGYETIWNYAYKDALNLIIEELGLEEIL